MNAAPSNKQQRFVTAHMLFSASPDSCFKLVLSSVAAESKSFPSQELHCGGQIYYMAGQYCYTAIHTWEFDK